MNVTYGHCVRPDGDGKWRVRLGVAFLPVQFDTEVQAASYAHTVGAGRRVLRTTYALHGRDIRADPGVPAEIPASEPKPVRKRKTRAKKVAAPAETTDATDEES